MKNKLIIKTLSNIFSKLADATYRDIFDKDENFTEFIPSILDDLEVCIEILELRHNSNRSICLDLNQVKELVKHSAELTNYLHNEELRHYRECDEEGQRDHIYNDIVKVDKINNHLLDKIYK